MAQALALRGPLASNPTARTLHALVLALAIWYGLWSIILLPLYPNAAAKLPAVILQEVGPVSALILLRFGFLRQASLVYLVGTWAFATFVIALNGGIRSPVQLFYGTLPILATWLLGYTGALWTAAACLGTVLFFALLELEGVNLTPRIQTTPLGIWAIQLQVICIGAVPVAQVLRNLSNTLAQSRRTEEELQHYKKHLERLVQERTAQLQDANRELEAFSYSVSHDLRAPLRPVEGFAKILLRDYPGKVLDEKATDLMNRMSAGAKRMGQLIDDLLMLSRINRGDLSRQCVDLSEVAASVLTELAASHGRRAVRIEVEPQLLAETDAHLMRVALENLLGNAWKFTSKTEGACIQFGALNEPDGRVYFVRDNGAGFDMAHADQLFAPFQRLHRADEFEGTGIGLATVQRIISRHGGRIWAQSHPGRGTTFYFTLATDGGSRN